MTTLKAEDISFQYTSKKKLLSHINFEIESNQIVGLFGESGSGKSTFCKILTGFIENYQGTIKVDDKVVKKGFNPVQLIYQHPEKVMNPKWSMGEILKESWTPSDDILDEFGVKKEWFKRYPAELSGGELQRFSILRALNPKTEFVICDEISTMLDAVTQVQIWTSLLNLAKKHDIGILLVSHDKNLIRRITDNVLFLEDLNHMDED
jgi:peptide/nickel transport system ATP-binding protein